MEGGGQTILLGVKGLGRRDPVYSARPGSPQLQSRRKNTLTLLTIKMYVSAFQKVCKGRLVSSLIHKELGNHCSHPYKEKSWKNWKSVILKECRPQDKVLPWKLEKQKSGVSQFTKSTGPGTEAHTWSQNLREYF